MREHISRQKKTTTGFSIPSLKHPIRGFGLESSSISRQAVPEIQPLDKPVTHDISRIPLRTQAKLSISQPGDIYEQEADSVAQQVMQRMAQPVNRQPIQREALPEEEEELQMKPLDISTLQREALPEDEEELQMKSLDISTLQREALPEDEEELQMKSLDNRTLQREALPEDEEELQMKSLDNRTLQREALPEDEEELQMKPMVQRQAEAGMAAAPDLEASINQARGGGVAIADNIRQPMEEAFGADFSGVKVHTDGQSDQLNQSIQARAFTTGQDVFFRQGEYNPGSRGGQELLAHELTHVVQQNGGAVMRLSKQTYQQTANTHIYNQNIQRKLTINDYNSGKPITHASKVVNSLFDEVVIPFLEQKGYKSYGIKSQLSNYIKNFETQFNNKRDFITNFAQWLSQQTRNTKGNNTTQVLKEFSVKKLSRPKWSEDLKQKLGFKGGDNIRHVVRNATLKKALEIEYKKVHQTSQGDINDVIQHFTQMGNQIGIHVNAQTQTPLDVIVQKVYQTVYLNEANLFSGEGPRNQIIGFSADRVKAYGEELVDMQDNMVEPIKVLNTVKEHILNASKEAGIPTPNTVTNDIFIILDEVEKLFVTEEGRKIDFVEAELIGDIVVDIGLNFGFDLIDGRVDQDQQNINRRQGALLEAETALHKFIESNGGTGNLTEIYKMFVGISR